MNVRWSGDAVIAWAPAKLNLFLEVLAKRRDGFHEIETLMIPVAWFDTLEFRSDDSGEVKIACEWVPGAPREASGFDRLPEGSDNIAVRAVRLLRESAGVERGATLRLVKRIPLAAGLAGGSSDAAAALVAANQCWRLGLSTQRLAELAGQLGSDVPFFLGRGPAICRGRGERIEPVGGLGALHCVVACPPDGLSTALVYRTCQPARAPRSVAPLVEALRQGDLGRAGGLLWNRLEEGARALSPWIERLRREFARLDVVGYQMSGSGTSYFGLCRNAQHAQRVRARLATSGVGRIYRVQGCP